MNFQLLDRIVVFAALAIERQPPRINHINLDLITPRHHRLLKNRYLSTRLQWDELGKNMSVQEIRRRMPHGLWASVAIESSKKLPMGHCVLVSHACIENDGLFLSQLGFRTMNAEECVEFLNKRSIL